MTALFKIDAIAKRSVVFLIRTYQKTFALFLGGHCRFYPSCSNYGLEAVEKKGVVKGTGLAFARVLKCHPFHAGGYDPVES